MVSPSAKDSAHRGLQPYNIPIWVEPKLNLRTSVLNLARAMSISLPVLNFPLFRNNPISFYTRKNKTQLDTMSQKLPVFGMWTSEIIC